MPWYLNHIHLCLTASVKGGCWITYPRTHMLWLNTHLARGTLTCPGTYTRLEIIILVWICSRYVSGRVSPQRVYLSLYSTSCLSFLPPRVRQFRCRKSTQSTGCRVRPDTKQGLCSAQSPVLDCGRPAACICVVGGEGLAWDQTALSSLRRPAAGLVAPQAWWLTAARFRRLSRSSAMTRSQLLSPLMRTL